MEDSTTENEEESNQKRCNIHINRTHIPLKLIYFFFMAGEACAMLYRGIYMRHLGMSTKQTGIIWTLERVGSILLPPVIGAITDKTRRPKVVLIVLLLGGAATLSSMYFIPQESAVQSGWNVSLSQEEINDGNISFCWTMACSPMHIPDQKICTLKYPKSNDKDCQTGVIDISSIQCNAVNSRNDIVEKFPGFMEEFDAINRPTGAISLSRESGVNTTASSTDTRNAENLTLYTANYNQSFSKCSLQTLSPNFTSPVLFLTSENVDKLYSDLRHASVYGTVESPLLCVDYDVTMYENQQTTCTENILSDVDEYGATFWLFLVLIFVSAFASIGCYPVIEASVLGALGPEKRHKFGNQRLWASIGYGSAALIVGYLKDRSQDAIGIAGSANRAFLSMFVGVLICWGCAAVVAAKLPIKTPKKTAKVRLKDMKQVLKKTKALAFFSLILFYGANNAIGEIYLFWLAEVKLNAPSFVLGLSTFVGATLDIPFCLAAGTLIKKFGHTLLICFGMIVFSFRLILCSVVTQPWQLVAAESLRGITWGLTYVVICSYTAKISPRGLEVSTMGITQASLWGIGYSAGALVGGVLFQTIGGDKVFLLFGSMSMCASILFGIFTFCTRNKHDSDVIDSEEDKVLDEETDALKFEIADDDPKQQDENGVLT